MVGLTLIYGQSSVSWPLSGVGIWNMVILLERIPILLKQKEKLYSLHYTASILNLTFLLPKTVQATASRNTFCWTRN